MAARRQECGICMGTLKNPKLISCHHRFCYKCLEDYVRVNLRNGRFDCPICRTNVKLTKGGVPVLQKYSNIDADSGEKFACDLCGPKSVACSRCVDCEENLCQSCCYVHEKLKVTRHHKVIDLGNLDSDMKGKIRQRIFCNQHSEEEIKLFCTDCKVLICSMCKAVNHENHATKTVADAAAEVKKTLQTNINSCLVKLRRVIASKEKGEELDRSIDDAEREELKAVEDQRSQLNRVLDQEVAKVKVKIKNVYHNLRQQNADFKRDVQDEFKRCSNANDNAQTLTDQGIDIEIIKKGPYVEQLISEAISKTDQTPNTHLKNKLFLPAKIKQSEVISLIGIMQDSTDSPTEAETSTPAVEHENKDLTERTETLAKVGSTERTATPPILNEAVVTTVDIKTEDVDSTDASLAVENEKNKKQKLNYKYKEDQWSPINHKGKKQYDRDFLLQLQNAPESTLKPLDLPDIPDIIIEKEMAWKQAWNGSLSKDLTYPFHVEMNRLPSKPSTSPPTQFQGQQFHRTHSTHARGNTPPQYFIGAQEADPQSIPYTGVSFPTSFQYSNIQSQFVPLYGYTNAHDLNKQAFTASRMPTGGKPAQTTMYNSTDIRQRFCRCQQLCRLYPKICMVWWPKSGGVPRRASGQRGRGGLGGRAGQTKHIDLSIQKDVDLHHAKGVWKPMHRIDKIDQGEVDTKSEPSLPSVNRDFADVSNYVDFTPRYVWSGGPSRTSHTQQNEIAAQFAAQVAQVALTTRQVANQQRKVADDTPPQQPSPVNVLATHQQSPPPMRRVDNQSSVVTNALECTVANIQETYVLVGEMEFQRPQEDTCAPDVYPVSPIDSDVQMDEHQFPPSDSGLQMYEHQLLPAHSGDLNSQPSSLSTSEPNMKSDFSFFNVSVHQDKVRELSTEHVWLQQQPKVDSSFKTGLPTASFSPVECQAVSITVSVESALKTRTAEKPASEIKTPAIAEQNDTSCVQRYATLERKPEKHVQHAKPTTAEKTPVVAGQNDIRSVPRDVTLKRKPVKQAQLSKPTTAEEQPVLSEVVPNKSRPEISLKVRMQEVAHERQPVHAASTPTTIKSSANSPHVKGPTPPQYFIGAQEADPQSTPYTGVSFPASFQYSNIQPQFVPQYGYTNAHDLNKQAYTAPRMPTVGNPSQATMYQNSTGIRQAYFNQSGMRPSSYQMSQPQPGQGLYPQQQIMFMPPPQYSSTSPQVIMPMTATNYTQRMPSPAHQNSTPTTQQGLFQVPQQNKANFAHTHTHNNPPDVFYNQQAQQQNRPPSASGTSGSRQQPKRKRERTVLQIIDPNSGKDIIQELTQARSTTPSSGTLGSHSTHVSGQEMSHTQQNEIWAQFAAQVAQVALTTRQVANQQRTMADDTPPQQPSPVNVFATHQQSPSPMGRVDNQSSVVTNTLEPTVANIQETSVVIDEMDFQRPQEDTCAPDVGTQC